MYNIDMITQSGKSLDKSKYFIDEENKIFSSKEDNLILDFTNLNGWNFKTGDNCTFETGSGCVFNTLFGCTFKTGSHFIFDTGSRCTFKTGKNCTFETGSDCTFHTLWNCTFDTGPDCTFKTGWDCIFKTGGNCTFNIFSDFRVIKTKGNSNILIRNKKIHTYLEDKIEIYFDEENDIILYTKNKLTEDKYLMMRELRK